MSFLCSRISSLWWDEGKRDQSFTTGKLVSRPLMSKWLWFYSTKPDKVNLKYRGEEEERESVFFSHKPGSSEHLSISFYIFSWCIFINNTDVMERKYPKFSLDVVQFHAGCCTGDRSFISVPFIGAVGFWWEADSHSDKVALSNYLAILALKLDATSEQGTSLKLIYCWLY